MNPSTRPVEQKIVVTLSEAAHQAERSVEGRSGHETPEGFGIQSSRPFPRSEGMASPKVRRTPLEGTSDNGWRRAIESPPVPSLVRMGYIVPLFGRKRWSRCFSHRICRIECAADSVYIQLLNS